MELAVVSEPHISMIIGRNPEINRILDLTGEWSAVTKQEIPFAQTAFLVEADFAGNNPEIVEQIQQKYKESVEFVKTNPDSSARMLVRHGFFENLNVATESLQYLNLTYKEGVECAGDLNRFLEVFYRMNPDVTGGSIPDENFYYKK